MTAHPAIQRDPAVWVQACIEEFVESEENTLNGSMREPAWARPLVGFSRGDDPLYLKIKHDIGPFYWTPQDAFMKAFPSSDATDKELTVISWILPQTERTKADNRKERRYPSERWARSRKYGEEFNVKL